MRASCFGETRGAARRQGHPAGCFESMGMVKKREGGGVGRVRIRGARLGKAQPASGIHRLARLEGMWLRKPIMGLAVRPDEMTRVF